MKMMFLLYNYMYQILNIQEPLIGEMGAMTFGGILGYSSGYAMKKVFKIVLIVGGLLFVLFQALAHYEILIVNWTKVQLFIGNLNKNDTANYASVLTTHLPMSGGFIAGFLLGFKKG